MFLKFVTASGSPGEEDALKERSLDRWKRVFFIFIFFIIMNVSKLGLQGRKLLMALSMDRLRRKKVRLAIQQSEKGGGREGIITLMILMRFFSCLCGLMINRSVC